MGGWGSLNRASPALRPPARLSSEACTVQGWQNSDWHSDNATRQSLFWEQRQFQDRFVALWTAFAERYRGNTTIAGYNVMNEPASNSPRGRFSDNHRPRWDAINGVYRRVVEAIRTVDPDHIIFLEGDYYSRLFTGFEAPFAANLVYSSHNYNQRGRPGLVRTPGRRTARGRDRAVGNALPLGPAPGAAGSGRLGGARKR